MDQSKAAAAIFDKLAQLYEFKYMDVSLYHALLDQFCDSIPKLNPHVFEIACGPGNITKYLLQKRPDINIFGVDLAPNMIELAKANNPSAHFEVMDCREIGTVDQKFDAVVCGFCLPYLTKAESEKLIADVCVKLLSGGIFYLSTIEGENSKSGFQRGSTGDQIYMNFYETDYLVDLLKRNDFEIVDLNRIITTPNSIQVIDITIIAKRK